MQDDKVMQIAKEKRRALLKEPSNDSVGEVL